MSTLAQRTSQGRRSTNQELKPTAAELEAQATANKDTENLPQSRKNSTISEQLKVETSPEDGFGDINEQAQVDNEAERPEEETFNPEDVLETTKAEEAGTGSHQGSIASVEQSATGEISTKDSKKSDRKPKIAFSEPQSTIQSTTSNYRVTRMFDSITVNRRRQSSAAPKPVLKFQPSYRLESSHPFNASYVEDLLEKFVEARMEEIGKIDFENHLRVLKICENLSFDIQQQIKAKNYDRYKILVNVTIVEKFHQGFRKSIGCLWDSETDAMATNVYDRQDLFIITTVFGIYYD